MRPDRWLSLARLSSQSRLNLLCLALTLVALVAQFSLFGSNSLVTAAICSAAILLALLLHLCLRPLLQEITALNLHAQNLQDGSFNTGANQLKIHALAPLAQSLNTMSAQLRSERATLYQRELLLDTVLQSSPTALLLTDEHDTILMANPAARRLLNAGKALNGSKLASSTTTLPTLAQAITSRQQGLLHLPDHSIWHLAQNQFQLNQKQHNLYLLKPMTREIQREELSAWKKLLRVIGHELNNTLAPLSSVAYSGEQRALQLKQTELAQLFSNVSERSAALNQFVQAYIQFAKLPKPSLSPVNWPRLINQLQDLYEFDLVGALPKLLWQADTAQLQQLLLNLLKNAHESGSDAELITLQFEENSQQLRITLQDAGPGMSEDQLQYALVPFYTSKSEGSGIGLSLCRDIIEAHGGSISLRNLVAGLEVSLLLPSCDAATRPLQ
ncbi:sensor histidine kinase [Rheinheimera maricola]|uniref:histidine kinase n=1 Tax=Rheinheimera maricola TaxID=2793282 RepID=A0ABS7X8I6_9GAMM|nr:ATP-binding protein [Rheinheimera maricola]MBZ9611053.1 PAS domain-containing protein [Rheinheimera maricola]